MCRETLRVSDEVDPEAEEARKIRLRLRHELYFAAPLQLGKQRIAGNRDFDDPGMRTLSPEIQLLVSTRVSRQDFRADFHGRLQIVRGFADPVLATVSALVADVLQELGVGRQLRLERNRPRAGV